MKTKTINFKQQVTFTGRNGTFKCVGVEVWELSNRVTISPITSKGKIGRCDIDIPLENLGEFINALTDLVPKKGDTSDYDSTPHDGDCAKRFHGAAECTCSKADMNEDD
jgi:hypothetical protein